MVVSDAAVARSSPAEVVLIYTMRVFAVRQVCEKYLANGKHVFWFFMDLERPMILSIDMVCGRCKECMELEENC